MKYKLFIRSVTLGGHVHTLVVDFETKAEADVAFDNLTKDPVGSGYTVPVKLY
jgi:hypothetical protein